MKYKRNERITALSYILTRNPNKLFTYSYFTEKFNASKSTISEDIVIMKESIEKMQVGSIVTLAGASGGVKYIPFMNDIDEKKFLLKMSQTLSDANRIITGKYVFMTDLIYTPEVIEKIGIIFASKFSEKKIDYVLTIETKGIPIGYATAKALNVPLVVVRKEIKVTEGTTVTVNYISKSSKYINSISLAKKSMKENSKVLIIDDFMRGGGTVTGLEAMVSEFNSEVVGIGIFIRKKEGEIKKEDNLISLLRVEKIDDDEKKLIVVPGI